MPVENFAAEFNAPRTSGSHQELARATDWSKQDLPLTWPDQPGSAWRLWWSLLRAPFEKGRVSASIPDELPGRSIPDYARQQFHGLPNGYYSHNIADGYDKGFEASMLFQVKKARMRMARQMANGRALDVGCGSGRLIAELLQAGASEVWGLDPSPYMLKIAQGRSPKAHFVQGLIEENDFPDHYFDSVGVCFVFHELPRDITKRTISELYRILKPGGVLCITEPCREHVYERNLLRLVRNHGLKGLYFHFLAKGVYEPFLHDWQSLGDHGRWLVDSGFELMDQTVDVPFQFLVARKNAHLLP